jgi:hypothetical protein
MYKVACTRREASCILGNFFEELIPPCRRCKTLSDDEVSILTEDGLSLTGRTLEIVGHSVMSGKPARVELTDYGFEFFGNYNEIARIRESRCIYGAVHAPKEG